MPTIQFGSKWQSTTSIIAVGLCLGGAATSASAQDSEASSGVIEEVVVTAQKRAESVQSIPLSVTAVSGKSLEDNGVTDLTRLELLTPGLQFGQSGNDARPAIRGARTENVSVQQDPVIGFFVDGVYRSRTSQALAAFVDVERVEVLRGPQGTLFGRNTFGGAINLISKKPVFETEAGLITTIGNFDRVRVEGYVNTPITDTLAIRVAASIDNHDAFIENTFNPDEGLRDRDETYVRASVLWEPNDQFNAIIRASRWRQDGNGASDFGYALLGTPTDLDGDGSFSLEESLNGVVNPINPRIGAGGSPVTGDPFEVATDFDTELDTEQDTLDIEFNYSFDFADLKVLLGYADFSTFRTADTDLSTFGSGFSGQEDRAETFTEEIQLVSNGDGPLQWTIGAFFLQDDTEGTFLFDRIFQTDPETNTPTDVLAPTSDFNTLALVDTDSYAVYGQATYDLTDQFRVTGGVRWSRDDRDFTRFVNFAFTDPINFEGDPSTVDSESFEEVTWRAGAEYDLTDDSLLYATVSTGFQSGGFNNTANNVTDSAAFDEQTITAYEIGSKNILAGGKILFNIAAFYNDFEDLLAQEFVDVGATVVSISTNAGAAEVFGIEAELDWKPVPEALINVRATYNDAEFSTFLIGDPISGQTIDLDGGRIPLTPDFTISVAGQYDFNFDNGGSLTPAFNVYISDSYSTNDIDYNFGQQDSFARLDLRLTYTAPEGRWFIEAFGRNVTDEAILNRTVRFGQNAIVQNFNNPATYGARFGFNF